METSKEFSRIWDFKDISPRKFMYPEIFQQFEKFGTEIFETIFIDLASSRELINACAEAHRYAVVVKHIDPVGGYVDGSKVFIYEDLFAASQKMNSFEYSKGVAVDVYDFSSKGKYLHLYYKLADETCYSRYAQPNVEEVEPKFALKNLWDIHAKVFY